MNIKSVYGGIILSLPQARTLRSADLTGADLREADLQGANFQRKDLRCANLSYANLQGADLRGALLRGANLYEANLEGAILPDGSTIDTYDPKPLFAGQDIPAEAWQYRDWASCPLRYAFNVESVDDFPASQQPAAILWFALDAGRHPCARRGLGLD